ncbi:MAG: NAD-dependent succinate-semialdehyde dehydrogenase [Synechococcaceae cyanobacterium SM2_3_2]|nr:NAD-dependent succinate-semialdehyde dehydrogenase [Synechococcaceae cyanobacterium SM2_3_2]
MAIASTNPATGEVIQTFEPLTDTDLEQKVARAQRVFETYRRTLIPQRSRWMRQVSEILLERRQEYGSLITLEMGKTLKSAIAEVENRLRSVVIVDQTDAEFLADRQVSTEASLSAIRYQPLGILLAVMPWNFPFWQVLRCAAPALMAGNTLLLKHASNVPQSALAIQDLFEQAGFPEGSLQTLLIGADRVAGLMADERIKAATLTGSESAGASLAQLAGTQIKKTVLELGGSDPFIVLPSANLDQAVQSAVAARLISNGQSCIAAKRFIIHEKIAEVFEARIVYAYRQLKLGDPMLADTDVGPLATPTIRAEVHEQVQKLLAAGSTLLLGGTLPAGQGNYYPPTLITGIPLDCPVAQEEIFGPVAMLFRVPDIDAAISLANSTSFGLGASAWTTEPQEQMALLEDLAAGSVFINSIVKSDPRLPFGGIKRSGYGRELGREGILEFVNTKTLWIQ